MTVRNPTRILCIDDTFSRTEWFNQPVVWFSGAEIKLLDRVVTKQELREWAEKYYQRKAERALAVQIAPNSMAKAEDALSPLIQAIPDLRIYHVEYGFTCAKGRRAD